MTSKMIPDESLLENAMGKACQLGAKYADMRFETFTSEEASAEDGDIKGVATGSGTTLGVRALAGGSWGFHSLDVTDSERLSADITECVERAVKAAKAASRFEEITLANVEPVRDKIPHSFKLPPLSLEEKKDAVIARSKAVRAMENIRLSVEAVGHADITKYFTSTEGAFIKEDYYLLQGFTYLMAATEGESQGIWLPYGATRCGWEFIDDYDPGAKAREMAEIASKLVTVAKTPKTHKTTVVTTPEYNTLQVHEIVGHPVEGDRVLGGESAWAGRAWWQDIQGQRIGSELVNAVSDARPMEKHTGYFGTFKYDDEGVPAKRVVHLENGILKDFLHSRQSAAICDCQPSGAMRAVSAGVMPIIRMTNTYFEPNPEGPKTEQEFLEGIKDGVLVGYESIPSIGSRRLRWQISAYVAWEIKNGERGDILKNISVLGNTPEFLTSVFKVGGPETFHLHQVPNCGKGDPMQIMKVGNGGPLMAGEATIVGGV